MSYKRFFKKCEEFCICGVIGNAGAIDMDGALDNNTIYHIVIKGTGRLGTPFDSNIIFDAFNSSFYLIGTISLQQVLFVLWCKPLL